MNLPKLRLTFFDQHSRILTAILCFAAISGSASALLAQQPAAPAQSQVMTTTTEASTQEPAPKIPSDQLDSLVAPIALYPDPLVAQVLAASTYPLEIVQLEQWMKNNKTLKDKALADAVAKQPYDPSVQSLAAFPDVVKQLSEHVSWTMDLGNAFLAQQADVMDAVQRMRAKAQGNGNLKTTAQQKVETQTVESGKQVIVIQPADPQVVYVPQYSPTVVYGPPVYPYPYAYPPGYGMLAFGTGVAMGAAWGACWGNCDWHGGGNVTINNNNNFNRNNINTGNRNQINNRPGQGGNRLGNQPGAGNRPSQMPAGGNWQHNPSHRGGAPYGDRGTANKFGGQARQQPAGGAGNRPGGGTGAGGLGGGQGLSGANRPGGGTGAANFGGANRPSVGAGASTRPAGGSSFGGGGNSIGNRSVSPGGGFGSSNNAFGGGGFGGNSARSASSRGGHSMGGGGFSGGGGRGGGGRGGGGGRRR